MIPPRSLLLLFVFIALYRPSSGFSRVVLVSRISSTHFSMTSTPNDDDANTKNLDYFAIGSMMHPVSIRNRGIYPISSEPAELLDHRIGFFTTQGYAEAIAEQNSSFHGVVHHLTREAMEKLDKIEQLYERRTATARFYDGSTRKVTVYVQGDGHECCMDPGIPKARYIEIMVAGCRHHGVDPEYIEFLEKQETVPRPSPDEYLSFESAEGCERIITLEEVFKNDGSDGKPLYISMNGKVIEVTYDRDSKEFQEFRHMHQVMGQVGEIFVSKAEFDPLYGIPERLEDVTAEHAAYCEHGMCAYLTMKGDFDKWKVIGKLAPLSKDESTTS